ncbi:hypothetical protein ACF1BN_01910 [Streptomyces sp. NPDC014861]|uniref:hypothetical protein n=1 Tax=Streptomyces sp. NPDC014861 TaxID=3364923 RepID=UPI0036F54EA4
MSKTKQWFLAVAATVVAATALTLQAQAAGVEGGGTTSFTVQARAASDTGWG